RHPPLLCSPRRPRTSPLFPSTTLFRSRRQDQQPCAIADGAGGIIVGNGRVEREAARDHAKRLHHPESQPVAAQQGAALRQVERPDRKSTRLNSSHVAISYAVLCLKKNKHHPSLTKTTVHHKRHDDGHNN